MPEGRGAARPQPGAPCGCPAAAAPYGSDAETDAGTASSGDCRCLSRSSLGEVEAEHQVIADAEVEAELRVELAIEELLEAEGVGWLTKAVACLELLGIVLQALAQSEVGAAEVLGYAEAEVGAAGASLAALGLELLAQGPGGEASAAEAAERAGLSEDRGGSGLERAAACVPLLQRAARVADVELGEYIEAEERHFALEVAGVLAALLPGLEGLGP